MVREPGEAASTVAARAPRAAASTVAVKVPRAAASTAVVKAPTRGGEEASPSIPIDQVASGNFNLLDYTIGYDPATKAFRGVVENRTGQTVCAVRVEAHVAMNGRVIEFGPTPGVDLAAGETLDLVLPADLISPDAYAVHPESSPCT